MRLLKSTAIAGLFLVLGLGGCQKEEGFDQPEEISKETLDKIYQMGFGTAGVQRVDDGYLVEGDIFLTDQQLNDSHQAKFLRIGEVEQYRTTNLVSAAAGTIRNIKVSLSTQLPSSYIAALDEALARYNNEGLRLTFTRVSTGADIALIKGNGSYLASAGFPTSTGAPYNQVKINSRAIGNQLQSTVATILAHEIGHCIGFRHTDYMDRSYSCNGAYANEGASTVGAVHIPGTPPTADPNSWMLACIGTNQNRPFNANDKTALQTLYKK
jgi:hypothetical protein